MRTPISLSLTILGASLLAAATLPRSADPDPISNLNECIQRRFLSTRSFGMARVLPYRDHGIVQFQPENAVEQEVVRALSQKGYQVAVFLAGRHVLDAPSSTVPSGRYGLQGPAYIADVTTAAGLPDREGLLADSRNAMRSFAGKDEHYAGYEVTRGDWVVALRPLRATGQTCAMCHIAGPGTLVRDGHQSVKIGDALGVAIYVYRRML